MLTQTLGSWLAGVFTVNVRNKDAPFPDLSIKQLRRLIEEDNANFAIAEGKEIGFVEEKQYKDCNHAEYAAEILLDDEYLFEKGKLVLLVMGEKKVSARGAKQMPRGKA